MKKSQEIKSLAPYEEKSRLKDIEIAQLRNKIAALKVKEVSNCFINKLSVTYRFKTTSDKQLFSYYSLLQNIFWALLEGNE